MKSTARLVAVVLAVASAAASALAAAPSLDLFGAEEPPFKFTLEARSDPIAPGASFSIALKVEIAEGYYLYREKMAVALLAGAPLALEEVDWPKPTRKHDPNSEKEMDIYPASFSAPIKLRVDAAAPSGEIKLQLELAYQGCGPRLCYPPKSEVLTASLKIGGSPVAPAAATLAAALVQTPAAPTPATPGLESPQVSAGGPVSAGWFDPAQVLQARGLLVLLLIIFGSGVALDFVACIYPMIPVTIAAIGAKENRHPLVGLSLSLCYVAGIVVTFIVVGVMASLIGQAVGLSFRNPWVAGVIAAIFVAMGLSMLGLYEIRVPRGLLQAMRVKETKGFVGAFVLGLVGGLIATPCGTPVLVGLATFVAGARNPALGALLFGTFGLGIGSLFIVIGASWGALNLLPKAGDWMEHVKKLFGVLMFAVALWLLSAVLPKVYIDWAMAIGLILVGTVAGAFAKLQVGAGLWAQVRKGLSLVAFVVGLYLLLVLLSGGTLFGLGRAPAKGVQWQMVGTDAPALVETPGQPAILYFTADWCSACRELKRTTFTDRRVMELAKQFRTFAFDGTRQTFEERRIEARYRIIAYPTLLFFNGQGRLMSHATVVGYVSADELAAHLQSVLASGP